MQDSCDDISDNVEGGVRIEGEDKGKEGAGARGVAISGARARDLLHFTSAKAGMENMTRTREEIDRIIYENSKGSSYWEEQRRKDRAVDRRILNLKRKWVEARKQGKLLGFQGKDYPLDFSKTYTVVDLDAFFASVELRKDPSLAGVPFAVGGIGMLSTSSYSARRFGVR